MKAQLSRQLLLITSGSLNLTHTLWVKQSIEHTIVDELSRTGAFVARRTTATDLKTVGLELTRYFPRNISKRVD